MATSGQSGLSLGSVSLKSAQTENNLNLNLSDYIPKVIQPLYKGKNSKCFKPLVKRGIYISLIKKYNNVPHVVQTVVNEIQENFDYIKNLLQIIPDLLLVQFQINDYSSQQYEIVVQELENAVLRQQDIQERPIIFNHDGYYTKALDNLIDLFVWHLCEKLTSNCTYLPLFKRILSVFVCFLRHLAQSEVIALRVTSFTFAFRINKFLSLRMIQARTEDKHNNAKRATQLFDAIADIIQTLQIDAIYFGRENFLAFQPFYLEFTKYFSLCVRASDKLFVNEKNLLFLAELVKLKHHTIVKQCIKICIQILNNKTYPREKFEIMSKEMYKRLNHKNDEIAFLASSFFVNALKNSANVPDSIIHRIVLRAYSLKLKIAQECGSALSHHFLPCDDITCYKLIIDVADKFDVEVEGKAAHLKYAYLVESLYNNIKVLQLPSILRALTRRTELSPNEYKSLVEIMYYVCQLHVRGRLSLQRDRTSTNIVPLVDSNSRLAQILKDFASLVKMPYFDDTCMIWVMKSLSLISYNKREIQKLKKTVTGIVSNVLGYFNSNNINQCHLWDAIVVFIRAAAHLNGGDAYWAMLENALLECIRKYQLNIARVENEVINNPDLMIDLKLQIVCELLKIKTIFGIGIYPLDLNLDLFYRYWVQSKLPDEIIKEQIMCSAYYFVNRVKIILETKRPQIDVTPDFIYRFRMDAMSLWHSLNSLFQANCNLRSTIFEGMAIFIRHYLTLFAKEAVSKKPLLKSAFFNYWEMSEIKQEIFDYFYDVCFLRHEGDQLPLSVRRNYVDLSFSLFYQPGQSAHECNRFVFIVLANYKKYYKHYAANFQRFFDALFGHSEDELFWVIFNTLSTVENEGDLLEDITFQDLLDLFAIVWSNEQKIQFIRYLHLQDDPLAIKYAQLFTAKIPAKDRLKIKANCIRMLETISTL